MNTLKLRIQSEIARWNYVQTVSNLERELALAAFYEGGAARVEGAADVAFELTELALEMAYVTRGVDRRGSCKVRVSPMAATVADRRVA